MADDGRKSPENKPRGAPPPLVPSPPPRQPPSTPSPPPIAYSPTCTTISSWGSGSNTYPPASITGPFSAIAAGNGFTLALKPDGTVVCWLAPYTAFGASNVDYGPCNIPAGLSDVVTIAAGWTHGLAITASGTVVVWGSYVKVSGYGDAVMLGTAFLPAFTQAIVAVAGGCSHSLALTSTGQVLVWGADNSFNQMSLPPTLTQTNAQRVTAFSSTANNNIALFEDGTFVPFTATATLAFTPSTPTIVARSTSST
ncbi:MAG: hypothetical protein WDW36_006806 [Sanguina aurantia]